MKLYEILSPINNARNVKRAKTIAGKAKRKSKLNNPSDEIIPSRWRADPHQGSMGGALNWR